MTVQNYHVCSSQHECLRSARFPFLPSYPVFYGEFYYITLSKHDSSYSSCPAAFFNNESRLNALAQVYTCTGVWPHVFGIAYPLASPATLGFPLPAFLCPSRRFPIPFLPGSLPSPFLPTVLPTLKVPVTLGFPPIDFPFPFSRVLAPTPFDLWPRVSYLVGSCHCGNLSSRPLVSVLLYVLLPTSFTPRFPPPLSPTLYGYVAVGGVSYPLGSCHLGNPASRSLVSQTPPPPPPPPPFLPGTEMGR